VALGSRCGILVLLLLGWGSAGEASKEEKEGSEKGTTTSGTSRRIGALAANSGANPNNNSKLRARHNCRTSSFVFSCRTDIFSCRTNHDHRICSANLQLCSAYTAACSWPRHLSRARAAFVGGT